MALNIKNEHTVALVRELAALTGESQTSAIESAVRARLAELQAPAREDAEAERRARMRRETDRILEQIWAITSEHPEWTREAMDEYLYDEFGLPR